METREQILNAALECFTEDGYEATTITRIRERGGVSNGALFHHFPTKDAIAGALYVDAMQSVQDRYWRVLAERPATLAEAVSGVIHQQLSWIEANTRRARFLYAQGHLDWSTHAGEELQALNRDLASAYRDWLAPFIESGDARDLPLVVVIAVVNGPAHAVAQRWLAGQLHGSLNDYADDLVNAAVAGLTGSPTTKPSLTAARPTEGRMRVQLLAGDGRVVAEGEATAQLTAVNGALGSAAARQQADGA
ncbi:TetR/AcrR family transcriptional regulator [Streptomyces bathyalis]|uniref:TetR/AcrR family transcriptional regulator n=1 Tax=Streptomyces bathyalis TaxID=2710756 RepID=A0A7T1TCB5_9ACTN|nr:TetR/AcrR family transcriptional regulator [Streptomyces bathyalis]QPP10265.1 TetR/AcrR family transcriptional regulator [Streptomyces bathyalis]